MLGAFSALTGAVSIESVAAAIRARFPGAIGEGNVAAANAAYRSLEPRAGPLPGLAQPALGIGEARDA